MHVIVNTMHVADAVDEGPGKSEADGIALLEDVCGSDYLYVKTSRNTHCGVHRDPDTDEDDSDVKTPLRKNYAGKGAWYDPVRDAFLPPSGHLQADLADITGTFMINGKELIKFRDEIDWTFVRVGEDSMMTLEFLLRGYKNRRSDLFVRDIKFWGEGGCSEFRDSDFHYKEHLKLMKKYPEYVYVKRNVVRKEIGMIADFKYKWNDAYKSSQTATILPFYR